MSVLAPTPLAPSPIERAVALLRGQRMLLDADLAAFFGVPTKRVNERVRRCAGRFPEDFAFRLTEEEAASLGRLRRAVPPRAFTARGVFALAGVLRGQRADEAMVFLGRAFILLSNSPPSRRVMRSRLLALERSIGPRNHPTRCLLAATRLMLLSGGRARCVVELLHPGSER